MIISINAKIFDKTQHYFLIKNTQHTRNKMKILQPEKVHPRKTHKLRYT